MIFNQEVKDKIEDALIHFEDAGYSFNINYDFYCNGRFGSKVYDVLKKANTNEDVEFGDSIYISLSGGKNIMTWKEYQWFQSELKTAVSRMTDSSDNVNIIKTTDSQTGIEINQKVWKFRNIADLTDKCKYFNYNNNIASNLVIYPEFHTEEGIVVYAREILINPGEKRFDIFNEFLSTDEINVSIERAFGKDCVVKMYEEGEAEKENPYLNQSQLSKYIVAKIKCDFIKV